MSCACSRTSLGSTTLSTLFSATLIMSMALGFGLVGSGCSSKGGGGGSASINSTSPNPTPSPTVTATSTPTPTPTPTSTSTPASCGAGTHDESGTCVADTRSCVIANGTGSQAYSSGSWGACTLVSCDSGYYIDGSVCTADLALAGCTLATVLASSSDSSMCSATGGSGTLHWAVNNKSGTAAGTMSAATGSSSNFGSATGSGTVTVTVTDSFTPTPHSVTQDITVAAALSASCTYSEIVKADSNSCSALGGIGSVTLSATGTPGGSITGGTYSGAANTGTVTITATDSASPTPHTATTTFAVNSNLAITCTPTSIVIGQTVSCSRNAGTGAGTVTWSVSGAPHGAINSSGVYSGADATGTATITATDYYGTHASAQTGNTTTASISVSSCVSSLTLNPASQNNYNIYSDAFLPARNLCTGQAVTINVNIGPSVVIGAANTTNFAMITNDSSTQTFYAGTQINIVNDGMIVGAGGPGGVPGSVGSNGGPALLIKYPVSLTNNNGAIIAGGGGGGGGGVNGCYTTTNSSGGGGAGVVVGGAGATTLHGAAGSAYNAVLGGTYGSTSGGSSTSGSNGSSAGVGANTQASCGHVVYQNICCYLYSGPTCVSYEPADDYDVCEYDWGGTWDTISSTTYDNDNAGTGGGGGGLGYSGGSGYGGLVGGRGGIAIAGTSSITNPSWSSSGIFLGNGSSGTGATLSDAPTIIPALASGQTLNSGQAVYSPDNRFFLSMQGDYNLVLYMAPATPLWSTSTQTWSNSDHVTMQADGNLVLYAGTTLHWQSNTGGNPGAFLLLKNDGNMQVVDTTGTAVLWQTNTGGH